MSNATQPSSGSDASSIASNGAGAPAAHRPGELLVQFRADADAQARAAAIASVGGQVAEVVRGNLAAHAGEGLLVRVTIGSGLSVAQAMEIVSKRPGVSFAEPNFIYSIDATSDDPAYSGGKLWGMYGDQTSPTNQFGSQAGEAWAAGHIGSSKVVIGVIDSGIDYTHPDLYLNVWLNQGEIPVALRGVLTDTDGDGVISFRDLNASENASYVSDLNGNGRIDAGDLLSDSRWENGIDEDGNGYIDDLVGWDWVNSDNDPYDDNNHGTHVSGTIAGMGGNGLGVAGVTWATQLVGLKFLSASGSGSTSSAIKAIDYYTAAAAASTKQDFAATNNSWGGGGFSRSLQDAIVRGAKQDVLFVAAAGNAGADNDSTANYPSNYDTTSGAGYDAVIAVASITSSGALSSFSNYGRTSVDLGAPGSSIYSTVAGGGYGTLSGTSMATPHVTGAIALFTALGQGQSAADIKAKLLGSTIATASLDGKTVTGGRLDAASLMATASSAPSETVNHIYGTTASETVRGTSGADKIWGVPATGTHTGRGTVDTLVGDAGADVFVLGDTRGRFYDDGNGRTAGTGDYAVIADFSSAQGDKIQLAGKFSEYFQRDVKIDGYSGMGIYHDSNGNGKFDSRDELIGIVQGATAPLASSDFILI